jgi:hypothetical protein
VRDEFGYGRAQNFEQAAETSAAIGSLLFQFRGEHRCLLPEQLNQERLRVKRDDAPWLQVLRPEVAKVEGHNDRSFGVRCDMAILSSFVICGTSSS